MQRVAYTATFEEEKKHALVGKDCLLNKLRCKNNSNKQKQIPAKHGCGLVRGSMGEINCIVHHIFCVDFYLNNPVNQKLSIFFA